MKILAGWLSVLVLVDIVKSKVLIAEEGFLTFVTIIVVLVIVLLIWTVVLVRRYWVVLRRVLPWVMVVLPVRDSWLGKYMIRLEREAALSKVRVKV